MPDDYQKVYAALDTLVYRDREMLKLLYGINHARKHSHAEVAAFFGVSRNDVVKVESRAVRRLRNRIRAGELYVT